MPHKKCTEVQAQSALVPAFRTASQNKPFVAVFWVFLLVSFATSLNNKISTYSLQVRRYLPELC